MMQEEELTRMAVQEIIREFGEKKQPTRRQECKINPLGKANKRFLGRTINSMITHNKREDDRKYRNCQKKLRDLEHRHRKRNKRSAGERQEHVETRGHNESESSHEVFSSDSPSSREEDRKKKKNVKRKKKKSKKRRKRCSDSDSSSKSSSSVAHEDNSYYELSEEAAEFYAESNVENNMALAAATYNQYLQYQAAMLAKMQTLNPTPPVENDKDLAEFEESELKDLESLPTTSNVKPEEISLLESTSSSSDSDSAGCINENDVLTIDLSSDDYDDAKVKVKQMALKSKLIKKDSPVQISDDDGNNDEMVSNSGSCISLNSSTNAEENVEIEISTDDEKDILDKPKIEDGPDPPAPLGQSPPNNPTVSNSNEGAVDLTLD